MNLLSWIALGCLAMTIMFVALLLSYYNFLVGPEGKGPQRTTDPFAVLALLISISGVPALIFAGVVFGMRKTEQVKIRPVVIVLIASGVIMIIGMILAITIVQRIDKQFIVAGIETAPYIFIAGGIGIIGIASYLFKYSRNNNDL